MASRTITWFPGHMAKAMSALKRVIKGVDLVLEVRDARVPLSSVNPQLEALVKNKRHIVVLNKADLVTDRSRDAALEQLQQQGLKAWAASSNTSSGVKQVLRAAVRWLQRERSASDLSVMMVVGLPNSGKSSLINAMKLAANASGALAGEEAYQKKARVGHTPGLTRQVAGFQVAAQPCVYMLDTPGIMVPAVPSDEVGLRLALAGAIKDSVVGEEAIVRYLLRLLHTHHQHRAALRRSGSFKASTGNNRRTKIQRQPQQKQDAQIARMRGALWAAATYSPSTASNDALADFSKLPRVSRRQAGAHERFHKADAAVTPSSWQGGSLSLAAASAARHPADDFSSGAEAMAAAAAAAALPTGHGSAAYASTAPWAATDSAVGSSDWSPSIYDDDVDADDWRLEILLRELGVAGVLNPSKQQGALIRVLQAFRTGQLGKYMLDDVG